MITDLCPRGVELQEVAASADQIFKTSIVRFFSTSKKDDRDMQQLEILGDLHRQADDAFQRHLKLCSVCGHLHEVAARPTAGGSSRVAPE